MNIHQIALDVPTKWNDLSNYQIGEILNCLHHAESITDEILLELLIYLFLGENPSAELKKNFEIVLTEIPLKKVDDSVPYLSSHLEFILNAMHLSRFPEMLTIGETEFYGPADRLTNLTIEELSFADHCYFNWQMSNKMVDLDRLVTVLYRQTSQQFNIDDIREPFSRHTLSQRGNILPTINVKTKLHIGYAFKGSRELMFSKFKILFPQTKKSFRKEERKPIKYKSFNAMINSMAMGETTPLGNLHQVKQTNALEFFSIVQETIIMQRERKKLLNAK